MGLFGDGQEFALHALFAALLHGLDLLVGVFPVQHPGPILRLKYCHYLSIFEGAYFCRPIDFDNGILLLSIPMDPLLILLLGHLMDGLLSCLVYLRGLDAQELKVSIFGCHVLKAVKRQNGLFVGVELD